MIPSLVMRVRTLDSSRDGKGAAQARQGEFPLSPNAARLTPPSPIPPRQKRRRGRGTAENERVEVEGRAVTEIVDMRVEPAGGGAAAELFQIEEEFEIGVELADGAELSHRLLGLDEMDEQIAFPQTVDLWAGGAGFSDDPGHEGDGAELGDERGVEDDLVESIGDLRRGARHALAPDRADLHDDEIRAGAFVDDRPERRIAEIAAIPIRLSVDHHRLIHLRNTGRSQERLDGEVAAVEDARLAAIDIGGGDEELQRLAVAQHGDVDRLFEQCPEIGMIEGIGLIGREEQRQLFHPERDRAAVEIPGALELLDPGAANGIVPADLGHAAPETIERGARPGGPALVEALRQDGAVHRPGARPADPFDLDPLVLEQAVEHAPGESAMRAAALERQVDPAALSLCLVHRCPSVFPTNP